MLRCVALCGGACCHHVPTHPLLPALEALQVFRWSRRNNYFMLCTDDAIGFGGGGAFGLFLDEELSRGTSGPCVTFDSPPLAADQDFACVEVELWGFGLL